MNICIFCRSNKLKKIADFGKVPRSFNFTNKPILKYNIKFYKCNDCLIYQINQNGNNQSYSSLNKSEFNNEPKEHFANISNYLDKYKNSKILFLSDYDTKFYSNYISKKKFILDSKILLNKKKYTQFEFLNHFIKIDTSKIIKRYGKFDIIFSSRMIEHCFNVKNFLKKCETLLNPKSKIIFEAPCSKEELNKGFLPLIWDEHSMYFDKKIISNSFNNINYQINDFKSIKLKNEKSLIFTVSKSKNLVKNKTTFTLNYHKNFLTNLKKRKKIFLDKISKYKLLDYRIIVFGAGHASITCVNYLNIKNLIEYVVDQNKNKIGRLFPGTNLIIKNVSDIKKDKILILTFMSNNSFKKIKEQFKIVEKNNIRLINF